MEKPVLLRAVIFRRFFQSFDMCQQASSNKHHRGTIIICRYEPHKAAAKFNPGQIVLPFTTYLKASPQNVTHKNITITGLGE